METARLTYATTTDPSDGSVIYEHGITGNNVPVVVTNNGNPLPRSGVVLARSPKMRPSGNEKYMVVGTKKYPRDLTDIPPFEEIVVLRIDERETREIWTTTKLATIPVPPNTYEINTPRFWAFSRSGRLMALVHRGEGLYSVLLFKDGEFLSETTPFYQPHGEFKIRFWKDRTICLSVKRQGVPQWKRRFDVDEVPMIPDAISEITTDFNSDDEINLDIPEDDDIWDGEDVRDHYTDDEEEEEEHFGVLPWEVDEEEEEGYFGVRPWEVDEEEEDWDGEEGYDMSSDNDDEEY